MILFRYLRLRPCLFFLTSVYGTILGAQSSQEGSRFPFPEKLTYQVQWRLVSAGTATVQLTRNDGTKGWDFTVGIESSGFVSRLYRVLDSYKVTANDHFCVASAQLEAQEGKRHSISKFVAENTRRKLIYDEHDLVKNQSQKKELDIAPCTFEIVGALAALRTLNLEPGKSMPVPITDGKKFAEARIEAQGKENISLLGRNYATTRYEAYLFDNVLYKRHGRLLIWISDAPDHTPVQFRLLLGFPIGTITVELEKQER